MIKLKPKAKWKFYGNMPDGTEAYRWGDLMLMVSGEQERAEIGWHISISHPHRYPTWDEIYTARYDFCPSEIDMAIFLPKKSEYVNIHPDCVHVHQIRDDKMQVGRIL
jgi:hypothetical protein